MVVEGCRMDELVFRVSIIACVSTGEFVIIMIYKHTNETHYLEREEQTLCVNETALH